MIYERQKHEKPYNSLRSFRISITQQLTQERDNIIADSFGHLRGKQTSIHM